jgi:hypothetical protein
MICNTEDLSPHEKAAVSNRAKRSVFVFSSRSALRASGKLEISDELRKNLAEVDG